MPCAVQTASALVFFLYIYMLQIVLRCECVCMHHPPHLIIQFASFLIGNILQSFVISPIVFGWSGSETIFPIQWFIIFHIIHQIEIAHFIIVGSSELKKVGETDVYIQYNI